MRKYPAIVLWLFLLLYLPAATAQLKVEVIPLQHRTAEQVIPVLAPLVAAGGTVTGMNNQLIIKTTPSNLEELKSVLASLDTPLHRLMITVRQNSKSTAVRDGASLDGSYGTGNVTFKSSKQHRGRPETSLGVTDKDGNTVQLQTDSERTSVTDNNDFQVQTVEGEPAWIQTGRSVPVTNRTTYIGRGGVAVQDTVDYRDVTSGFYVIANLHGDRVTLAISPNMSRAAMHRHGFAVQNIRTTVQGRLGQWIPVGGIDRSASRDGDAVLSGSHSSNRESRTVLLKVDEVK